MNGMSCTQKRTKGGAVKFLSTALLLLVSIGGAFGQVATTYTFSESVGTYTAITGGTQLVTTTAGATTYDTDASGFALPVGSQFTFNGTLITSVTMVADGALVLGTSTAGTSTSPISSTMTATGIISALGMDLRSTSIATQVYERRWQDVGTEVVFQWQNAARYLSDAAERFSFQIRVTKSTGAINVVYGNMTTIATGTAYQPQVGLRGTANTDFNARRLTNTVPDATPNWGAPNGTAAATTNAQTCRFTTTATAATPASGLTFTWTPIVPCTAPTVGPTSLVFSGQTSTQITGTYAAASTAPTGGYLVVRSTSSTLSSNPVNGTTYTTGTSLGGGTVIAVNTPATLTFTATTLVSNTQYYFFVIPYNSQSGVCTPAYGNAVALSGSTYTCPGVITGSSLTATGITQTGATLNWTAPTGTISSYTLQYRVVGAPSWTTVTGIPSNTYTLTTGTLTASSSYEWSVMALNTICNGGFTSNGTFSTLCSNELAPTAVQTFSSYTGAAPAPACWSEAKGTFGALTGTISDWLLKTNGFANASSLNPGVGINLYGGSSGTPETDWIISQPINLGATAGLYRVSYKMAVTTYNATASVATLGTHTVKVVVSTDGGATWSNANTIKTYTGAATYSNTGITETIDLTAYSGVVKIGFLATTIGNTPDIDFHIDDFKVELIPSCLNPTASAATSVTGNSAIANWTGGTGSYIIEYGATGFTPGTGATAGTGGTVVTASAGATNITLSGLSSTTAYQYYVRQVCTGPTYSPNSSAIAFTTLCGASAAPTTLETFTTYAGFAPAPTCWSEATGTFGAVTTADAAWLLKTNGFANITSTNKGPSINLYGGSSGTPENDWVISNPINLGATPSLYRVSYKMAVTGYNATTSVTDLGTHTVKVVVSTDGGVTWSNANVIKTYTSTGTYSNTGATEVVNLTGYSGVVKIGFLATTIGNSPDIDFHIDDFLVEAIPACAQNPSSLSSSAVLNTTATISWAAASPAPGSGYEYYYSTSSTAPISSTVASGSTAAGVLTANLISLTPNTLYYFWVRSNCNGTDKSSWVGSATFTTACNPISTFPWNEGFEGLASVSTTTFPSCWLEGTGTAWSSLNASSSTYHDARTGSKYIGCYYGTSNNRVWTPGFQLTAGTSYDFSTYFVGDGYTTWVGDVIYNTSQSATGETVLGSSFITSSTTSLLQEPTTHKYLEHLYRLLPVLIILEYA
jgi:hypothetical protein